MRGDLVSDIVRFCKRFATTPKKSAIVLRTPVDATVGLHSMFYPVWTVWAGFSITENAGRWWER